MKEEKKKHLSKAKRDELKQMRQRVYRDMYAPGRNRAEKRRALKRMNQRKKRSK